MTIKFSTGFFRNNIDLVLLVLIFCAISCTTNNQVKENPVTNAPSDIMQKSQSNDVDINKPANTIEETNVPPVKGMKDRTLNKENLEPIDKENKNMDKTDTIEETTGAAGRKAKTPGDKAG